jgi:hypothetical protein
MSRKNARIQALHALLKVATATATCVAAAYAGLLL